MSDVAERLAQVRRRIDDAVRAAARPPGSVALVAVAKGHGAGPVRAAYAAGQRRFGESYLQEALAKQAELPADIEWHFVGPLQSNKTRAVAEAFDWVHSVDRLKVARRLAEQRPAGRGPLSVCLQVNISGEPSKAGAAPEAVAELAAAVAGLPRLHLRGLMAIPAPSDDEAVQRAACRRLRELQEALVAGGLALDTLSMGMSDDLEAAIAEGATLVRLGTAVFGPRPRAAAATTASTEGEPG